MNRSDILGPPPVVVHGGALARGHLRNGFVAMALTACSSVAACREESGDPSASTAEVAGTSGDGEGASATLDANRRTLSGLSTPPRLFPDELLNAVQLSTQETVFADTWTQLADPEAVCTGLSAALELPQGDEFQRRERDERVAALWRDCRPHVRDLVDATLKVAQIWAVQVPVQAFGEYDFSTEEYAICPRDDGRMESVEGGKLVLSRPNASQPSTTWSALLVLTGWHNGRDFYGCGSESKAGYTLSVPQDVAQRMRAPLDAGTVRLELAFGPPYQVGATGVVAHYRYGPTLTSDVEQQGLTASAVGVRLVDSADRRELVGWTPLAPAAAWTR